MNNLDNYTNDQLIEELVNRGVTLIESKPYSECEVTVKKKYSDDRSIKALNGGLLILPERFHYRYRNDEFFLGEVVIPPSNPQ